MPVALIAVACAYAPSLAAASSNLVIDLGYSYEWLRREVSGDQISIYEYEWARDVLFVSLEVDGRAGFSIEGMIGPPRTYDRRPGRKYRYTTVGASLWGYPMSWGQYKIGIASCFHQTVWLDESFRGIDARCDGYTFSATLTRTIGRGKPSCSFWVGPVYEGLDISDYFWWAGPVDASSRDNWGLRVGATVVLFDHIVPHVELNYVNFLQPEIGVSYRF